MGAVGRQWREGRQGRQGTGAVVARQRVTRESETDLADWPVSGRLWGKKAHRNRLCASKRHKKKDLFCHQFLCSGPLFRHRRFFFVDSLLRLLLRLFRLLFSSPHSFLSLLPHLLPSHPSSPRAQTEPALIKSKSQVCSVRAFQQMVVINSALLAKKFPQLPVNDVDQLVNQFR